MPPPCLFYILRDLPKKGPGKTSLCFKTVQNNNKQFKLLSLIRFNLMTDVGWKFKNDIL